MPTVVQVDAKIIQREPGFPGARSSLLLIKERNKFAYNGKVYGETDGNIFRMVEKMVTIPILELTVENAKATRYIVI